jgi:hypothetical protein
VPHHFGDSTGYDLIESGKRYPPKAVLGLAARRLLGKPLGPYDFKGGEQSQCFRVLRGLGFTIEKKPAPTGPGTDWSEDEVRALVADYFAMLVKEAKGEPYSKTSHRMALMKMLPGRSKGSVEFKYQNVSGVLFDLGFPFIDGYKPAKNYETEMLPNIVLEYLGTEQERLQPIERAATLVPAEPPPLDYAAALVDPPEAPPQKDTTGKPPPTPKRFNFAERDANNRKLGDAGEDYVVGYERWALTKAGHPDLATKIEHVSKTQGDGLGYDVASFDPKDRGPIFIEVKTTNQGRGFPFLVSVNEVERSQEYGNRFRLYRVFTYSRKPQLYMLKGSIAETCQLTAVTFSARPK